MRNVFFSAVLLVSGWVLSACSSEPAALDGLRFEPSSLSLLEGQSLDVRLVATYDDGSSKDVTGEATFQVEGDVAEWVSGRLVARRFGTASLQAKVEGRTATAAVDVRLEGLRLEAEGAVAPGVEAKLLVFAQGHEGKERLLEGGVEFTSSDEAVATVAQDGTLTVHAGGPVTITAEATDYKAEWSTVVTCEAPTHSRMLWLGQVVPPLAWPAKDAEGKPVDVDLASMRCDASWNGARTVTVVLIAGWCVPCSDYVRSLQDRAEALRALGMELLIVMVEDRDSQPATLDEAFAHVDAETQTIPGYVASDPENLYQANFWRRSGLIRAFPTVAVIRLDDMVLIAESNQSDQWPPLEELALLKEGVWSP